MLEISVIPGVIIKMFCELLRIKKNIHVQTEKDRSFVLTCVLVGSTQFVLVVITATYFWGLFY